MSQDTGGQNETPDASSTGLTDGVAGTNERIEEPSVPGAQSAPPTLPNVPEVSDTAARETIAPVTASVDPDAKPIPSKRPIQAQPAIRPVILSEQDRMRPEVPGQMPTGIEGEDAEREIRRRSRRSFLWAGAALAAGAAGWKIFTGNPQQDNILSPLRHALQFNESLSRSYFSPARLAPNFPVSRAQDMKVNGTYGVEDALDADAWRLKVQGAHGQTEPLEMTLEDIKALPRVEMVTEHKCIEGWSVIVHWAGARFSDFAAKHMPPNRNGGTPDLSKPGDLVRYVGMATPDGAYYVGLDMESALHPQTLLCYEMNGKPLAEEHGAPLRLVVPIKYGIKSIKRIGTITYADKQPADYWAELGYDWYAGH